MIMSMKIRQKQNERRRASAKIETTKKLHPPTGDDEVGVGSPLAAMARMVALTKARLLLLKNSAYLEELAIENQKFSNAASMFDENAVKTVCESLLKRGFFDDCSDLVSLWFSNHELRDVASQMSCCAGAFRGTNDMSFVRSRHSTKLQIGFQCRESFELVIEQFEYARPMRTHGRRREKSSTSLKTLKQME